MKTIDELIVKIDELITAIKTGKRPGDTTEDSGSGQRGLQIPRINMEDIADGAADLGNLLKTLAVDGAAIKMVFSSMAGNKDAVMDVFKTLASGMPGSKYLLQATELATTEIANTKEFTKRGGDTNAFKMGEYEKINQITYEAVNKAVLAAGNGGSSFGSLTGDKMENINQTLVKLNENAGTLGRYRGGSADPATLAKALVISSQGSRANLADAGDQDRAVLNAQRLADEIDKTAKLTGRLREEIADELAGRMKSNQFLLEQFGTNEEGRQSYIRSQAAMAKHGTAVQDLSNDFLKFGTATEKTMGTMIALGPAGMELRSAIINLKNATNEKERKDAEAQVATASTAINERGRDPRLARMAAMADAFPELKALQSAKQVYEQNQAQGSYNYQRNRGLSSAAATLELNKQVARQQAGGDAKGDPLQAGQVITQANFEGNRVAAVGAGIAFGKLNTEMGKAVPQIEAMIKELQKFNPPIKLAPTTAQEAADREKNRTTIQETKGETRNTGTLGETGSMFEPKDIIALLHKNERVLNPKENKDLTSLYEMIGNLKAKGDTEKDSSALEIDTATATNASEETQADSITLKDVHESLQRLNSTMEVMASHTADMKDSNRTTADMSQKMTGNRLAV
jgi:hypothetical protein